MALEAKEPAAHRTAVPVRHSSEHLVLSTSCVMTDGQLGAVYKVDATPLTAKSSAPAGKKARAVVASRPQSVRNWAAY